MLHGPENPQSLENQDCPKKSSRGSAVDSTSRCNHSLKNEKRQEMGFQLPLCSAAPSVGWLCLPAVQGSSLASFFHPQQQDMWASSSLIYLDGNFQVLEKPLPLIFTCFVQLLNTFSKMVLRNHILRRGI